MSVVVATIDSGATFSEGEFPSSFCPGKWECSLGTPSADSIIFGNRAIAARWNQIGDFSAEELFATQLCADLRIRFARLDLDCSGHGSAQGTSDDGPRGMHLS